MARRYQTTISEVEFPGDAQIEPLSVQPVPPQEGGDWDLIGTQLVVAGVASGGKTKQHLLFFWRG